MNADLIGFDFALIYKIDAFCQYSIYCIHYGFYFVKTICNISFHYI